MLGLRAKVASFSQDLSRFSHEISDGLDELQRISRSKPCAARKSVTN